MDMNAVHPKTNEAPVMAIAKRSSPKSKKVQSKASKESSIPRHQSDECLSKKKKKKRNGTGVKRSKSFGKQPASASSETTSSSTPHQPPFCIENMGVSPSMLAMLQHRTSATKDITKVESVKSQINEASDKVLPKRSSTRSKKLKSNASAAPSVPRRQSEQCLSSNTKAKRKGSSMKRSKSFGEQTSSASLDPVDSSVSESSSVLTKSMLSTKPQIRSTDGKKLKAKHSKASSIPPSSGSEQSMPKPKRNSTGVKRSKSFGDSSGTTMSFSKEKRTGSGPKPGMKRTKSFGDTTIGTKPTRRISKQKKAKKTSTKKENGTSIGSTVIHDSFSSEGEADTTRNTKKNSDRRVHFSDKIRVKKIKHSKLDYDLIWYSEEEISAHREREQEVKRRARTCHNVTLLNLEGLMTIQERDAMFQRQIDSKEAVFDVQNAHMWYKEEEAANAIFSEGTYMESLDSQQDEAIAEEYEIFTVSAIQCAHDRAGHLAMHVKLLWDQDVEFNACGGGLHDIKLVGAAPIATQYRTVMAQ